MDGPTGLAVLLLMVKKTMGHRFLVEEKEEERGKVEKRGGKLLRLRVLLR